MILTNDFEYRHIIKALTALLLITNCIVEQKESTDGEDITGIY